MELDKLCEKYGFTWDYSGMYIKIKSNMDVWYIEDELDYSERCITLYHGNKSVYSMNSYRGRKKSNRNTWNISNNQIWHRQTSNKMNLKEVFRYICRHDKKYKTKGVMQNV
jgi:hypothetical protein